MKKPVMLAVGLSIFAAGCVDQTFHVRQNVSYDRFERDAVQCRTIALQNVPNNSVTNWMPYVGFYTEDTNAVLRQQNHNICMGDRGYQEITVPACTGAVASAARAIFSNPQYRQSTMNIQADTCYITDASSNVYFYPG